MQIFTTFFVFLVLSVIGVYECYPAFNVLNTGARPFAMGNAYSAISDDAYAVNPAGLSWIEELQVSTNYNSMYSVHDIENYYWAFIMPVKDATMGVSFLRAGISGAYYEDTYFLRFSRGLSPIISLGVNFKLFSVSAPGYGSTGDPLYKGPKTFSGYDVGFYYGRDREFRFAVLGMNLNSPGYKLLESSPSPERLNADFIFAGVYTLFDKMIFSAEYQLVDAELRLGSEVSIADLLFVRLGTNRNNWTGGAGIRPGAIKNVSLQFDMGFAMHRTLGMSYQASTIVRWSK